jgi:hypothetical protein
MTRRDTPVVDAREFVRWILDEYEPACRVERHPGAYGRRPGSPRVELYGVADLACILHTLRRLRSDEASRAAWAEVFAGFQDPLSGRFAEQGKATHVELHATAFAVSALELFDLEPTHRLRFADEYRRPDTARAFVDSLDWRDWVYLESHRGAGLGSIFANMAGLRTPSWFAAFFTALEGHLDPNSGLFGDQKPTEGDLDQIGGTFHYAFVYEWAHRPLPHPEARIDSVLGLQAADGLWDPGNPLWLTLDAVYLLSRASRRCDHRRSDVHEACRRALVAVADLTLGSQGRASCFEEAELGAHALTATVSLLAESQSLLGAEVVRTDHPLRCVLDRRPFV